MTNEILARARAGDEDAFRELTDPYRRELQLHIYRIVGSAHNAEDLLQETLLSAWRGLEQFEGRASVRAWLYRIATNRSLDALRASRRHPEDQRVTRMPEPTRWSEPVWLEPYPDALLEGIADDDLGPEARYEVKEAIALAFVVGLQHLPPQQRGVLVLRDVLGLRAGEVAEMLETSDASVNSLLRRARAAFESSRLPATGRERAPLPNSKLERDIVGRFADAVEVGDVDGMVALLTDDSWLTMPPLPHQYQGRDAIGAFLRGAEKRRGRPLRLVPTRANTHPAFGCYLPRRNRRRMAIRVVRPHAGRRPDIRDHLVRRQQRVPAVRVAADISSLKRATAASPGRASRPQPSQIRQGPVPLRRWRGISCRSSQSPPCARTAGRSLSPSERLARGLMHCDAFARPPRAPRCRSHANQKRCVRSHVASTARPLATSALFPCTRRGAWWV